MKLAENIRAYRRARSLTQEQLAEVLDVTGGAVYKWEAGLSQPELRTLMEMADFFDTSVDALLGYEVKDNRLSATVERLKRCRYTKDDAGFAEAEKALKKYPNAFAVAYNSGALYRAFGTERGDRALLRRGLELMESAMRLLAQNDDPKISQSTISGEMAMILLSLGELDQAVELLKKNNAGDLYSDLIGLTLAADCRRPEEALPFLSSALLDRVTDLVRTALGYVNVYFYRKDFAEAKAMLGWILGVLAGVKDGEKPCFADKIAVMFRVCLAYAHLQTGDAEAARRELSMAKATAASYDAAPDPRAGALRFVLDDERAGVYDNLGATCAQTVEKAVGDMESDELCEIWRGLDEE